MSVSRGLTKRAAIWVIAAPVFISLLARAVDSSGWNPCDLQPACGQAINIVSMIGAAFPHGLTYWAEMFVGAWILPILLAVDIGLMVLVWRRLPEQVAVGRIASIIGTWVLLSLATFWLAPYLVVWTLKALA